MCVCVCIRSSLMIYCDKWSATSKQQASHSSIHTNKLTNKTNRGDRQTSHQAEWRPSLRWSITVRQIQISVGLFSCDQGLRVHCCVYLCFTACIIACMHVYTYTNVWPYFWGMNLCVCGCQSTLHMCVSEQACVWYVTQAEAAQHISLFKGLFVLLQLVQLLRTDKQDLELWAAKHRPPTPSQKPLWPSPALWPRNGQTNAYK